MNVSISARSMLDTKAEAVLLIHGTEGLPLECKIDIAIAKRWPEPHGKFLRKVGHKRFGYKRGRPYFIRGKGCPSLFFARIKDQSLIGTIMSICEKIKFEEVKSVSLPPLGPWDLIDTIRIIDSLECSNGLTMHFDLGEFYDEKMAETIAGETAYRMRAPGPEVVGPGYYGAGIMNWGMNEMRENIEEQMTADTNGDLVRAVNQIREASLRRLPRLGGARPDAIIMDDMEDDEQSPIRAVEPVPQPPRSLNNILGRWYSQYNIAPPGVARPSNTLQQAHDIFEELINPDHLPYRAHRGEQVPIHIMRYPECAVTEHTGYPAPSHQYITLIAPRNMTNDEVIEWAQSLQMIGDELASTLQPWTISRDSNLCPYPWWYRRIITETYDRFISIASVVEAVMMTELHTLLKPLTEAVIQSTTFISRTDAHTIIGQLKEERLWRNDPEEILRILAIQPIVSCMACNRPAEEIFIWLRRVVSVIHFYLINYDMAHNAHDLITEALYEAERSPLP